MNTTCQDRISQDNRSTNGEAGANNNHNNGRDGKGRSAKGNVGGPGNPFARQVGRLRKVLLERVTEEAMAEIADGLVMLAKGGDLQAIKLIFQYTLGKPAEAINPDRLDVDEAERFEETAAMQKGLLQSALAPDPAFALDMVRAVRPALAQGYGRKLTELIQEDAAAEREQAEQELQAANRAEQRRQKAKARRTAHVSPSANGHEPEAPSANGDAPAAPSTNGEAAIAPSTNGHGAGDAAAASGPTGAANGSAGNEQPPSTNGRRGGSAAQPPSANEKKVFLAQLHDLFRQVTGRNREGPVSEPLPRGRGSD